MREVLDQPAGLVDELFLLIGFGLAVTALILALATA